MSSVVFPVTGSLEYPLDKKIAIALSRSRSAATVAISILGTITSRVMVSENSSTDSIRSCSYSSASVESLDFLPKSLVSANSRSEIFI